MKQHLVALLVFGLAALAVGQSEPHAYDIDANRALRYGDGNPSPSRWKLPAHWLDLARGEVAYDCAVAASFGTSYGASEPLDYALLTYQWLFDYREVWLHDAPPELKFKVELSGGVKTNGRERFIGSLSGLAVYFPSWLATERLQPYIEGGVGGIYTDFRVEGQGFRWNFHPQAGIGALIHGNGPPWYVALRFNHLSNAGLDDDNKGTNAVALTVGRFF
jgi:lipid A 3-O-deacylase